VRPGIEVVGGRKSVALTSLAESFQQFILGGRKILEDMLKEEGESENDVVFGLLREFSEHLYEWGKLTQQNLKIVSRAFPREISVDYLNYSHDNPLGGDVTRVCHLEGIKRDFVYRRFNESLGNGLRSWFRKCQLAEAGQVKTPDLPLYLFNYAFVYASSWFRRGFVSQKYERFFPGGLPLRMSVEEVGGGLQAKELFREIDDKDQCKRLLVDALICFLPGWTFGGLQYDFLKAKGVRLCHLELQQRDEVPLAPEDVLFLKSFHGVNEGDMQLSDVFKADFSFLLGGEGIDYGNASNSELKADPAPLYIKLPISVGRGINAIMDYFLAFNERLSAIEVGEILKQGVSSGGGSAITSNDHEQGEGSKSAMAPVGRATGVVCPAATGTITSTQMVGDLTRAPDGGTNTVRGVKRKGEEDVPCKVIKSRPKVVERSVSAWPGVGRRDEDQLGSPAGLGAELVALQQRVVEGLGDTVLGNMVDTGIGQLLANPSERLPDRLDFGEMQTLLNGEVDLDC